MKRFFAALSLVLLAAAGLAQAEITDAQVVGRWISTAPVYQGGGLTVSLGMEFEDSTITVSSVCTAGGKTLEAAATVPVNIAGGKIEVKDTARAEVKDGGTTCNVEVTPATIDYAVNGGALRLTMQGQALDFRRR